MEKVDLHGVRHGEVSGLLIRKIEEFWNKDVELHIVTGYSEQMKEIVINILNEYKLDYQIGDFLKSNNGYITTIV